MRIRVLKSSILQMFFNVSIIFFIEVRFRV